MKSANELRETIKGYSKKKLEGIKSDQELGIQQPELEKRVKDEVLIDLPAPDFQNLGQAPLSEILNQRRSRRKFTNEEFSLDELSYLLWATSGIQRVIHNRDKKPVATLRTVPSAGARHPFETYLLVSRVSGLLPGLYRYQPTDNGLVLLSESTDLVEKLVAACCGQKFAGQAAVTFIWTAIPYRMEWRYSISSPKFIAQDSGHLCQNLYLASEALGGGTCGIGAYFQDLADELIGVDGEDEFVIYISPTGKIPNFKPVELDPAEFEKFCGQYKPEKKSGTDMKVFFRDNALRLESEGRPEFKLVPIGQLRFLIESFEVEIFFECDEDGKISTLNIDQGGEIVKFWKV